MKIVVMIIVINISRKAHKAAKTDHLGLARLRDISETHVGWRKVRTPSAEDCGDNYRYEYFTQSSQSRKECSLRPCALA